MIQWLADKYVIGNQCETVHLLAVKADADTINHQICDDDLVIPRSTNWDKQQITDVQTGSDATNDLQ